MRVIVAKSYDEFEAKEKELLDLGFRFFDVCEVRKIVIYCKLDHGVSIKCNFWNNAD